MLKIPTLLILLAFLTNFIYKTIEGHTAYFEELIPQHPTICTYSLTHEEPKCYVCSAIPVKLRI